MLRYCGVIFQAMRALLACLHADADRLQQSPILSQLRFLEVAQEEVHGARGGRALQLVEMEKPLARVGRLRREVSVRQRRHDAPGKLERIDQLGLGAAGMGGDPADRDGGFIRREGLVDNLADLAAVQRVGEIRGEPRQVDMPDARADLLVGREAEAQLAVRQLPVRQQMTRQRHQNGDASLVVGAEQRAAAGGDDVVAELLAQVGVDLRHQDQQLIVGKDDGRAVIVAMHTRLDRASPTPATVSTCASNATRGTAFVVVAGRVA